MLQPRRSYVIVNFSIEYTEIYYNCFGNLQWLHQYGLNTSAFNLSDFITTAVLQKYPNVERLIVLDNGATPIFFAHLCFQKTGCVIVGGLVPEKINSGQGVNCSTIIVDYIFKKTNASYIEVSVKKYNSTSLKLLNSLGFTEITDANIADDGTIGLQIKKEDYPNRFVQYIFKKVKYEKR